MSLFDKIKNQATQAATQATQSGAQPVGGSGNQTFSVVFATMPESLAQLMELPQSALKHPGDTAALLIAALCVYPLNVEECKAMIDYLRGPNPMSARDHIFLRDRMAQNNKAPFLGASYLNGATPQNEYTPSEPYTVVLSDNPYSYSQEGIVKLFAKSGGADTARPLSMRQAKDGKWYLWGTEYHTLLADIRAPESRNPWV